VDGGLGSSFVVGSMKIFTCCTSKRQQSKHTSSWKMQDTVKALHNDARDHSSEIHLHVIIFFPNTKHDILL